jgi:O6-methylguanine-DNA--protein-cysteine methyltransferase
MTYTCTTMPSPVGELKLVANGSRLAAILWENDKPNRVRLGPMTEAADNPILMRAVKQLQEYFAGGLRKRLNRCSAYCLIREAQYAIPAILASALEAFPLFDTEPKNKKETES